MGFKIGIHSPPAAMTDMIKLWKRADEAGFHWISVSDHLYTSPPGNPVHEGVAIMTALAANTKNVRVGNMMFCLPFRNPALLAQAAITIDHLSGGRCELGVGAGWLEEEFHDFGIRLPSMAERMEMREEGLHIIRSLFAEPVCNFSGKHYQMTGARLLPKPVNGHIPLWVGGKGLRKTPDMAARYADGFNAPFMSPEDFSLRVETIRRNCEAIGRDPAEIRLSLNLLFMMGADEASARRKRGEVPDNRRDGALCGTLAEVLERIAAYQQAGADFVNLALPAPYDWDALEAFIEGGLPTFSV